MIEKYGQRPYGMAWEDVDKIVVNEFGSDLKKIENKGFIEEYWLTEENKKMIFSLVKTGFLLNQGMLYTIQNSTSYQELPQSIKKLKAIPPIEALHDVAQYSDVDVMYMCIGLEDQYSREEDIEALIEKVVLFVYNIYSVKNLAVLIDKLDEEGAKEAFGSHFNVHPYNHFLNLPLVHLTNGLLDFLENIIQGIEFYKGKNWELSKERFIKCIESGISNEYPHFFMAIIYNNIYGNSDDFLIASSKIKSLHLKNALLKSRNFGLSWGGKRIIGYLPCVDDEKNDIVLEIVENVGKSVEEIKKYYKSRLIMTTDDEEKSEELYSIVTSQIFDTTRKKIIKEIEGVRAKVIEDGLVGKFGKDNWNKLNKDSQVFLITSKLIYRILKEESGDLDFSPACIAMTKALEKELNVKIYHPLMNYIRNARGINNVFKDGTCPYYFTLHRENITLGSFYYIFGEEKGFRGLQNKSNEQNEKKRIILYDIAKKANIFVSNIEEENLYKHWDFLNKYSKHIADKYRNEGAHDKKMEMLNAEKCYDLLIKVEKILIELLVYSPSPKQ